MIKKIINVIERILISKLNYINTKLYMKYYTRYLKKLGVNIVDYRNDGYIDPTVWIDGSDYHLITIGEKATISKEVILLTHDYSIRKALAAIGKNDNNKRYHFLKSILIGNNCFIGARSIILPGTTIGDNVIIGAGSVVKGVIESNSIVGGVPAKKISSIQQFAERHINEHDYNV